jgi:hypothetical protein
MGSSLPGSRPAASAASSSGSKRYGIGPAGSMMAGALADAMLATAIRDGSGSVAVPAGAQAESAAYEAKQTLIGSPSASDASSTLISTSASSLTALARACFASSPWSGGTGRSRMPLISAR